MICSRRQFFYLKFFKINHRNSPCSPDFTRKFYNHMQIKFTDCWWKNREYKKKLQLSKNCTSMWVQTSEHIECTRGKIMATIDFPTCVKKVSNKKNIHKFSGSINQWLERETFEDKLKNILWECLLLWNRIKNGSNGKNCKENCGICKQKFQSF